MLEKDDGIVLRTSRRGETSLDVTFLGRQRGKVRLIAKGAMGPQSKVRGALEPSAWVEVVYYYRDDRPAWYLKEAVAIEPLRERRDLTDVAVRLAAVELLDQVCYPRSPDADVVDVAVAFVSAGSILDPLSFFLAFELHLLAALGATPDFSACAACGAEVSGRSGFDPRTGSLHCRGHMAAGETVPVSPEALSAMREILVAPLSVLGPLVLDVRVRKTVGKVLHGTYTFHVQGYTLPKSLQLI